MPRRVLLSSGVRVFAAALLLAAAPVWAETDRRLEMDYDIFLGGFHALTIHAVLAPTADSYDIRLKLETRGLVDTFFSWTMTGFSKGLIKGGKLQPQGAGSESLWRGKRRIIGLNYGTDGTVNAELVPPIDPEKRDPVPQIMRWETVDLGSAVLAIARSIGRVGGCGGKVPVFDGRRRYDLELEKVKGGRLARNQYSAYRGKAVACRLKLNRIKGFLRAGTYRMRWLGADRGEAVVWMARIFDGLPPLPVRMESEVLLGLVRGHLAGAVLLDGPRTRRITRIGAQETRAQSP